MLHSLTVKWRLTVQAKKEKVYHVVFDEDGGKVEPVPVELVVEIPN